MPIFPARNEVLRPQNFESTLTTYLKVSGTDKDDEAARIAITIRQRMKKGKIGRIGFYKILGNFKRIRSKNATYLLGYVPSH